MSEISTIGLDLAKNVFQVHAVDPLGGVVLRRQLRRGAVEKFFAQLAPCTVGMEACGSAHHWARVIGRYGHQVWLMPPAYVKPYVKRNKNDGRDAEAICEAVGRPTMRFVPVKSVEQQATLAVHGTRALLVRQRTMAANALRAALSEIGIVAAQGLKGLRELMATLEAPSGEIPEMMRGALLVLARHWQTLDADERALERQIAKAPRADAKARRPGGGGGRPDHRQYGSGQGAGCQGVSFGTRFCGLDRADRSRSWHRRQASSRAYLQTGRPHAPCALHQRGKRSSAAAEGPWCQQSVAARAARAQALQGRDGGIRRQDRAYHLGHAGQRRSLPRPRQRVGCCLIEGDSPRARAPAYRKGNYGVMANGQETGIETLRTVIARHSAPQ